MTTRKTDFFNGLLGLPSEIALLLNRGDFPQLTDDEFAKVGAWLTANVGNGYDGLDPASLEQARQVDAVKKRLREIYEYNAKLRSANRQGPRQAEAPKAESRIGHVDSEAENEILSRELFADLFVWQQREKRWQRELGLHAPTTADEVGAIIDELSIPAEVVGRIAEITDMMGDLDATDDMLIAAIKNDRQTAAEGADNGTGPTARPTAEPGHTKQQPWSDDAPEYLPLAAAEKLTDGRLSVQTLSKMMTPTCEMCYMRKGQRCKVHIADFYRYLKARQSDPEYVRLLVAFMACEGKGNMRFVWKCSSCGAAVSKTVDRCPNRNCSGHEPASFSVKVERVPPPQPRR